MNSYAVSGKDSVRLLLMSATPITQNPMELIKLLNLCKPAEKQFPLDFLGFSEKYLDESGVFTATGRKQYLDEIAGMVSYLNREKDARQFAQPVISYAMTPIMQNPEWADKFDKKFVREYLNSEIIQMKTKIKEQTDAIVAKVGDLDPNRFRQMQKKCSPYDGKVKEECLKIVRKQVKELIKEAKEHTRELKEEIRKIREEVKNRNLFKTEELKRISARLESDPAEYASFRRSLYMQLKKCGKTPRTSKELTEALEKHPTLVEYNAQLAHLDENIENAELRMKTRFQQWNPRIKRLRQMLRYGELNELESSVVRMTILEETGEIRKMKKTEKKDLAKEIKEIQDAKRNMQKTKRKVMRSLVKTLRRTVKDKRAIEKETERAEKELQKEMRRTGELEEEIGEEYVRDLVTKYEANIDAELENKMGAIRTKEEEKQAKQQEKEELRKTKKAQQEAKKQEKEALRTTKKQEKEAKKREKEEQRNTKKRKP